MRPKTAFQHTFFALGLIVLAGLVADLVLWPRDELPAVTELPAQRYFSELFIDRAQAFRGTQSLLGLAALLTLVAVPLAIAWWWPRSWAGFGDRPGDQRAIRPGNRQGDRQGTSRALAYALVGGGVAAVALLAALPFELVAFTRARDVGLAVQGVGGWLWSWFLAALLTVGAVALLSLAAGGLIRRFGRTWWPLFGVLLIASAIALQALAPVVISPLFADFKKLPAGQTRSDVEQLARRSGVRAGEIYVVDAAARTNAANAYVTGLGSTKRVVLYDTLLRDFDRRESRAVIAHELGHAHYEDLTAGLVWFGFVAMASLFAVDLLARVLAGRRGIEFDTPAAIASLVAAAMIAVALSQPAANAYSRRVEARTDAFALKVTADPRAAISLERRLTVNSIARPEPPALLHGIFGTHPTPMQRIGMAETVKREQSATR